MPALQADPAAIAPATVANEMDVTVKLQVTPRFYRLHRRRMDGRASGTRLKMTIPNFGI